MLRPWQMAPAGIRPLKHKEGSSGWPGGQAPIDQISPQIRCNHLDWARFIDNRPKSDAETALPLKRATEEQIAFGIDRPALNFHHALVKFPANTTG